MAYLKHPKVVKMSDDGQIATIKFILSGELVMADFQLFIWASRPWRWPPRSTRPSKAVRRLGTAGRVAARLDREQNSR